MSNPVLHPKTKQLLNDLNLKNRKSYLFSGPDKIGKKTTALWLSKLHSDDPVEIISPKPKSISIDSIHQLQNHLKHKSGSGSRFVVIDQADTMSLPAQNAVLKTIEEPPVDTNIILISSKPHLLLDTIISRVVEVPFSPPKQKQLDDFINELNLEKNAKLVAETLNVKKIGEIVRLNQDQEYLDEISRYVNIYETITNGKLFESMAKFSDLLKDKSFDLDTMLEVWSAISRKNLHSSVSQDTINELVSINRANEYIDKNVNKKLIINKLMLELK